jgi:hypothetical protein
MYLFNKRTNFKSAIASAQAWTIVEDVRHAFVEAITALQAQPVSTNIHMTGVELDG